jgi:hypothetical protein
MVPETAMMRDEGLLSLESTGVSDSRGLSSASLETPPRSKEAAGAAEKNLLGVKEAAMPWRWI